MIKRARIMVATEIVDDAALITKLLSDEFDSVIASTDLDRSVQDFEEHRPNVLLLAFNSLEKAERYYLGLYRLSTVVHALPHRTLILCNKDDLLRVYALCKKEYFDEYILFWPITQDAPRLRMAVHHALRQIAGAAADVPSASEFAAQARRIARLESLLEQSLARGGNHIERANQSLQRAGEDIGAALDSFSCNLADGMRPDLVEVRDGPGLQREFTRLRTEKVDKHLQSVATAMHPVAEWAGTLKEDLRPELQSARALQAMAERVRPRVLVVDDDEFQHRLLMKLLEDANLELSFAASGTEALAILRKCRPDIVLMDFSLPDIDGVEVTRRLKSNETFATIPVIMITGHSSKAVVVESLQAGAVDFVVKPFDKYILLTKVRKFLTDE
ncbi:MAG: response regulator [Gammaproteobacteria bacterium]